jgi:hypothetical protein
MRIGFIPVGLRRFLLALAVLVSACGGSDSPVSEEAARASLCLHLLPLRASAGPVLPPSVWEGLVDSLRLDAVALRSAGLDDDADRAERLADRLEEDTRPGDPPVDLTVFLLDDVTPAQRTAIQEALERHPDVEEVDFETKEEAYERFVEIFGDNPDLVAGVTAAAMPESFRVDVGDGGDAGEVGGIVSGMPGVDAVREGGDRPVILTFDVASAIEPLVRNCPEVESGPP